MTTLSDEVLSIPDVTSSTQAYTLSRTIAAIRLIVVDGRRGKLGDVRQLPPGARLNSCGIGYDERTIKVHYDGGFYFVFLQDLEATNSGLT
jgi:hypothetical protein